MNRQFIILLPILYIFLFIPEIRGQYRSISKIYKTLDSIELKLTLYAPELGIDPEKVDAAGGSAGSHLAAGSATLNAFDDPGDDLNIDINESLF